MKNESSEKKRMTLWRRMKETYDRVTLRSCRGEYLGCHQLLLQGCREILEYGKDRIVFAVEDPDVAKIAIEGSELVCLTYHSDAVTVCGNVTEIRFETEIEG